MVNEGKAEMEGRLEGDQKEVNAIVEQQTRYFREDIEGTRRELEARLAAVEARAGRWGRPPRGQLHYGITTEIRQYDVLGGVPSTVRGCGRPK